MMNSTKSFNSNFMGYFVLFVWGFVLMEVGFGQNQATEIKVGVVLDLQTLFSKICLTSMNMSLSDFYKKHTDYTTRLAIHVRDSMEDVVQASAAALDLIKNEEVSAIIGPRSSMQTEFMIRLANISQVPTITFSATCPSLTSINSPYFVRATLDDSSQVRAIAAIIKSFGWRNVVAVYVDNEFGKGIMSYLSDALNDVQAFVVNRCLIPQDANDDQILKELYKLMTMQTRVFVVHMPPTLGFRFFQKAREIGMMEEGYVWLLTDGVMNLIKSNERGSSFENMQGVLGVRSHITKSKDLEDFRLRWKKTFEKKNSLKGDDVELNIFVLRAYDSITALAMAVENTNIKSLWYDNPIASANNKTDLGTLKVSRYGPSLLEALSNVRFKGLAGEFKLVNRQFELSAFEVINIIGNEERIIGFWRPGNGLVNANSNKTTLLGGERFGPVIWPGKSHVVPKGWEIPTNGKMLRVGVPVKKGFLNFVDAKKDPITNELTPTGYCIDVFEAALKKLHYSVIPKYIAFVSPDENYDEMVYQVYNGTYDAVVGDVTIIANRSLYVDFTLPYTESGVSMMVPLKENRNKNTWVFLKPWSLDLWVTTTCFFVFIGFIVWILEHRVNTDFRGPPHHQIGTSFWFAFSTMNFAHREKVVSNLARFVVLVWCFVVLVLIQSYTANLTSFLTVQRFQPEVTNWKDLIKNNEYVGYQRGTFVGNLLESQGFQKSQLKPFGSAEECDELFSNGTIAASFDEVAYLKLILSKNCSRYAMVFPKNSPLTDDVSRAILNVTQGEEMQNIENKWFKKQSDNCPDPKNDLSSNSLSVSSFWGLFLIAGIASFLALLIFVVTFLYEHKLTLFADSEHSFPRKLKSLVRIFDEKDIKSHTFKENAVHNVSSPITQGSSTPLTDQGTPLPRSSSQNREFESRSVPSIPNGELFTLQSKQVEDEESTINVKVK
ncbi:PREDICTED: glutamate receptor 2.7-like isoform X1 [Camelina sativa]|uniref:Glutamate receptor n=2 Tax=Camelina sativa TaxID=90675 RepID=A0ABM1RR15_CAMSA|nr:PREDICTED: glutamate receptor 2.7-like isoform X1 [Camelina sativa]